MNNNIPQNALNCILENKLKNIEENANLKYKSLLNDSKLTKFQKQMEDEVFYVRVKNEVYNKNKNDFIDFCVFKEYADVDVIEITHDLLGYNFLNCYLTYESANKDLPKKYKIAKVTFLTLEYFFSLYEAAKYKLSAIIFEPNSDKKFIINYKTMSLLALCNGINGYYDIDTDFDFEINENHSNVNKKREELEEIYLIYKKVIEDNDINDIKKLYKIIRNEHIEIPVNMFYPLEEFRTAVKSEYFETRDFIDFTTTLPGNDEGFCTQVNFKRYDYKDSIFKVRMCAMRFNEYVESFLNYYNKNKLLQGVFIDPYVDESIEVNGHMMYFSVDDIKKFAELEKEYPKEREPINPTIVYL